MVAAFSHSLFAAVPPARSQQLTSPDQVPEGLAKSDWSSIRAAYEAGRHAFQPTATGWQARNPGQQWTTSFDRRGFVATPKAGGWTWGLELQGYGFGNQQQTIAGTPAVQAVGSRLTYQWDTAVQEWFVNDTRGLEHGFTVSTRPAADTTALTAPGAQPTTLSFLLAVRGELRPHVTPDALGVEFRDAAGATLLNYAGLKVWDADGKVLTSHFELAASSPTATGEQHAVRLLVDERDARYPLTIDPIAQQAYLKASNTGASDNFGYSVAVSGDTVVVGANLEDSCTTGVNSTPNELALDSGAAYVFTRSGTTWSQQAYLKASNTGASDQFGAMVAVSGDTVVVGAYGEDSSTTGVDSTPNEDGDRAGAAYVFTRSGTTWSQQAYLKASNTGAIDRFGLSVAVSGDTVVVGAPYEDSSTTGVDSTPNESALDSGATYIFTGLGMATVTTPTSASIAATSATLGGDVTSAATITAIGIVYAPTATNPNPQIGGTGVTTVAGSGTTGVFTVSASSFTANTAYTYAAYATTSAGTTYSSGTFTTLPLPPAITNGTLTASGTYGSAITTYTITGSNIPTSYSATGLPAGLSLDAATGAITGTPTTTIGSPFSVTIGATNAGGTGTATLVFTVAKATPTISVAPTASGITYGQTLASSTLSSGTASVAGAFTFTTASTAPAIGTAAQGVTFTPTDTTNYNATTTTVNVTVAKATPTISVAPTASGITYGQTLASSTLSSGTASVAGTFTFTTTSTAPNAGTAAQGVTFTPSDTTNYNATTTTVNVTVAKATPTITGAPTATGISYGQTLASSTLSGGTASVGGTFTFTTTSTSPSAGTAAQGVTFTPTDTTNYNATTTTVNVTVAKATPTVTWATPSAITYGTALSATQLNASGSVAGAIVYSPASGTTLSAGTQTLTATFTPTDTANYNTASGTVSLVVGKATPTLTWATPSAITYGTALSATQLNASGSVAGAIVYSPASGTTPSAGTQTLTATFTPTDTTNYNTATGTVSLVVGKATPTLTWATPSAITYGTALSATQLNASGSAAGAIVYSPASGTTLSAGTQTLTATFTPTDTANYNTTTGTVSLTVNKATPTLTWATPATITYGTALSATQLNATASVAGSFAYSPASGLIPSVGTQTLSATFTPTDTTNFNSASASVSLNVIVAVPGAPTAITATTANGEATLTFTAPSFTGSSAITGYTIRATATDGSIVTVNATGSPAKITGLTPGKSYRFTVTANNSAGSSDMSTTSDALTISLVNQTITFASLADRTSNSGSFDLAAIASSGLPVTFTVVSGPALLSGNVVDLTGATGTVKIRASQTGNATYAAATDVDVAFAVTTGQLQVIFGKAVNSETTAPMADLAIMLRSTTRTGSILLVSNSIPGLNGAVDFTLNTGGNFSTTLVTTASNVTPLYSGIQAAPVTYTITGTLLNSVFSGTIAPLGLVFRANATALVGPTAAVAGFYKSTALLENSGVTYSVIGANNEVLALTQNSTVTAGGLTNLKSDNTFSLAVTTTSGNAMLNGSINSSTTTAYATLAYSGTTVNFAGLSVTTTPTDRLINLSSRAKVGTGESVLITGFVIGGTDSKKVLIRAVGPALSAFGLASTLPNPEIKIYQGSNLIAQNDDWNKDDAAEITRLGAFAFSAGSKDAALLTTLAPGSYTAQIADPSGTGTGVALAEIYDASLNPNADYQRLVNISSRGQVTPDDGVLIGGFIVTGNHPKTLLIRGVGPALASFGIAGALADPALTIYQDSKAIATNEGWANSAAITTAAIQTGAFTLSSGSKDAAVLITLNPGAYTAQIKSAKNASSGVALIEIYEVP
jgi:hypothetical protein